MTEPGNGEDRRKIDLNDEDFSALKPHTEAMLRACIKDALVDVGRARHELEANSNQRWGEDACVAVMSFNRLVLPAAKIARAAMQMHKMLGSKSEACLHQSTIQLYKARTRLQKALLVRARRRAPRADSS